MHKKIKWIFYLYLILTIYSCKQEKDEIFPIISISNPHENSVFSIYDTIKVNAKVSDETSLKHIEIYLSDENYVPIMKVVNIKVIANSQDIATEYELNDRLLPSGNYFITIRAGDGENIKHKYQAIKINGIKHELLNILIADESSTHCKVLSLDTSLILTEKYSFSKPFLGFNFLSAYDQFLYWSSANNQFLSLQYLSCDTNWKINLFSSPPDPNYIVSTIIDRYIYISDYNSTIRKYNYLGKLVETYMLTAGYYSIKLIKNKDKFISIEKHKVNGLYRIAVYYASTFFLKQSLSTNFLPISMAELSSDEMLIVGNNGNLGIINTYSTSNNSLQSFITPNLSKIIDIQKVDDNNFYVADENHIYWYRYNQSSFVKNIENINPVSIYFDSEINQLFVLTKEEIKTFLFPNSTVSTTKYIAPNCKAFIFRYTI